jgi:hypothetical protein
MSWRQSARAGELNAIKPAAVETIKAHFMVVPPVSSASQDQRRAGIDRPLADG